MRARHAQRAETPEPSLTFKPCSYQFNQPDSTEVFNAFRGDDITVYGVVDDLIRALDNLPTGPTYVLRLFFSFVDLSIYCSRTPLMLLS